jgi:Phosphotransferase enzyme family
MASFEFDSTLRGLLKRLPDTADGGTLCHGDFHPKNIVMGPHGLVVVDWFDACRGNPCGDIARASLLLSPRLRRGTRPTHLPGASPRVLDELHDNYMTTVREHVSFTDEELENWLCLGAAARLSEGVDHESLLAVLEGSLIGHDSSSVE